MSRTAPWATVEVAPHEIPDDVPHHALAQPMELRLEASRQLSDGPQTVDGLLRAHRETRISDDDLHHRLAWLHVHENVPKWRHAGEAVVVPLEWQAFCGLREKRRWDQGPPAKKLVQAKHVPEHQVLDLWHKARWRGVGTGLPHFPRKVLVQKIRQLGDRGLLGPAGLTAKGRAAVHQEQ